MISRWIPWLAMAALAVPPIPSLAAEPFEFGSPAGVTKGAELKGRIVETRDGEELGRIHDFAVDLASGRVAYVVVSVGSFLIEDSLIAVAPDALRESADADGRLVLETDAATLRDARRFSAAGNWPVRADVLAAAGSPDGRPAEAAEAGAAPQGDAADTRRGTATISDGNRTATLSAGERSIRFEQPPAPAPAAERPGGGIPKTRFEHLDADGDGVLNRAEIAHELGRRDSYSDIDLDGSGTIDDMEFDALVESRTAADADPSAP